MTKEVLKDNIKTKFGTLSNFARLGGFDRYRLQIIFARGTTPADSELQKINTAYETLEPKETGDLIDPVKLAELAKRIDEYGGVYKFCQDHPKFKQAPVYALISGKRKRNSTLVKKLFKHFKI